ncbi:Gfo/Idh/MocA family protein [Deinococcus malanensis]|nr:Gfo/Idh/MocA family oxidoreductase [Deinococcus malanensis]
MRNSKSTLSHTGPLRLIQIGLGGWGRDWMKIVRAETQVEAAAFVDASPDALKLACERGAPDDRCFTSLTEALRATEADAALVTTNAHGHAPVALAAIEAGLPVLVEKPFTPTIAEARAVVNAAHARGVPLMVSQNYRHHPASHLAAQLVREGRLGEVGYVEVDFRRDHARAVPAPAAHHRLPHPLLLDMAIHHFDLMRFVLGREPLSIDCHAFNPPWSPFVDPASATATITFEGGVVVSYRGSWASSGPVTPWAGEWRLDTARGEVRWTSRDDPSPDRVDVRQLGQPARSLPLPETPNLDRAGVLATFVQAIHTGAEPESSGRDNLGSLALALAAVRSAEEGRTVLLAEIIGA